MTKRLEGRDEPILEPDLPIVDAHFHLFDRPGRRYMMDDYLADANAGHRIAASVYIETQSFSRADGPAWLKPLGEVEFANGVAAIGASEVYGPCRIAAAVVGHADLRRGAAVGELLDRQMSAAPDRFRGIRQITLYHPSEAPYRYMSMRPERVEMTDAGFRAGFAQLAPRGLSFDAAVFHTQLGNLASLAGAFPDTIIVLNHMGMAMGLEADRQVVFDEWRQSLHDLARLPNVVCKVGGLGMPMWGLGFETRTDAVGFRELADAWRPYIETAVEAFGVDRCMLESNFPPDGLSCGFVPLWNALKYVVRGVSADEKAALFHRTATRVYRLTLPAPHNA